MSQSIAYNDWIKVLEEMKAANPGSEGFTTVELASHMNMGREWVIKQVLRPLVDAGKIVSGKRRSTRIDGATCWVSVYRLAEGVQSAEMPTKAKTQKR